MQKIPVYLSSHGGALIGQAEMSEDKLTIVVTSEVLVKNVHRLTGLEHIHAIIWLDLQYEPANPFVFDPNEREG
jgi:hypothetical protein